jgi:2-methylcitrate dehydratase
MDSVVLRLVDFAHSVHYDDLPPEVVDASRLRLVDYVGVGLGGHGAPPSAIARALAARVTVSTGARVLGTQCRTLPELAAFANGVMARYLDGNDNFPSGGHPSDTISALLAAADQVNADGRSLIAAIVAAYEVYYCLFQSLKVRDKGYDYVIYTAGACAIGAAKLLRLDPERSAHALSLALTPNLALGATRRGHLSMWKGCAGGNAARNGVFAALLAAEGMTGPEKPVEGSHGLFELMNESGMAPLAVRPGEFKVLQACTKNYLTEYHSQLPVELALELHAAIAGRAIRAITIHTYWFTFSEIGNEPEKWHPTTRETADHSLPFIIAAVLIDGAFSDAIFSDERLADARIHALADRIAVREDLAFSARAPRELPCRIEVELEDGTVHRAQGSWPLGHFQHPMPAEQIEAKFTALATRVLPAAAAARALDFMRGLERQSGLDGLFGAVQMD